MDDDGLDAARGIANGLLLSLIVWGVAAYFWGGAVIATVAGWFS